MKEKDKLESKTSLEVKKQFEVTAIMARGAVREDDVLKDTPVANI